MRTTTTNLKRIVALFSEALMLYACCISRCCKLFFAKFMYLCK
ncbi:hypothetical protein HMPREF3230_01292 [Gardnerella vaginalis]|uniref:Uncharacterized protein n=1 Tax=Gardnerella vaginalis TaxID=2702 RepID=A0A135Z235_GARVA|nr:hypothetical protein HMPREF3230_01292 [Gardnerella vaginalis]